jgi:DNA modification methylase
MSTKTSSFGTSKREGHDSSVFYSRNLFDDCKINHIALLPGLNTPTNIINKVPPKRIEEWTNQIYCHTAEDMCHIPDESIALAFTSPPYNVGKEYDKNLDMESYLQLISKVGAETYRVLKPGGRYVINIANLGRKPYIPIHAYFYLVHSSLGFLPAGEIIWRKSKGANNSCAWGSWLSAKSPRLRDIHEYLLVFVKDDYSRPDSGTSDMTKEDFMSSTLSVWEVQPESAVKVGHPAPFPVELAKRVIKLFSYVDDVILDPFVGSGTTCVAAKNLGRYYVGYEIEPKYCTLCQERLNKEG